MKTWMEGCNQHPAPPRSASYGCIAKWSACSLMFCVCSYGVLLLCCCIAVVLYLQLWCFAILLPTMMTTTECTNLSIYNNSLSPKAEEIVFAETFLGHVMCERSTWTHSHNNPGSVWCGRSKWTGAVIACFTDDFLTLDCAASKHLTLVQLARLLSCNRLLPRLLVSHNYAWNKSTSRPPT